MYVAVKGGETAIAHSLELLADKRRGDRAVAELSLEQIDEQLGLAVDRVMTEGSLYDRELAALAIKQARGDLIEAIFLLRAYRTTLPRFGESSRSTPPAWWPNAASPPPSRMCRAASCWARPTTIPTACSTSRSPPRASGRPRRRRRPTPTGRCRGSATSWTRGHAGTAAPGTGRETTADDLTREPLTFPRGAAVRLQNLARGDEGFLLALGYSTQRGYGSNHPFVGEIRFGAVPVSFVPEELGFAIEIGRDRRHRMRHGQPVRRLARRAAAIHPRLRPRLRPRRAQGDGHGAGRPGAACRRTVGEPPARRPRTRSSCWPTPTMSRPRASSSISSCRTMSTSSPSWWWCGRCAPKSRRATGRPPMTERRSSQAAE